MTGCPLVPAAFAARPALRLPRWDRHLVPLPGAQIAVVFGAPVRLERNTKIDRTHLETVGAKLDEATRRAWKILAWSLHRTANLDMLPESDQ
jgi:lysophospholipid acyltransferase (LPLAT)-like uncharacterized protein